MMSHAKTSKSYEMDMCNGPLLGKIIIYALPLMLSGVLQLTFNAVDLIVVGRYAGSGPLASVGSTSALINLMLNLFIGLSVGANVLVANYYGAGEKKNLTETIHTAVTLSIAAGFLLIFVGFFLARPILVLMGTPEDILDGAVLYIRIYFAGMPVIMFYNFGSAILRAIGDTRRPLYYLCTAGVINIFLNLIFVCLLNLSVAGVALGTVLSQLVSASLLAHALLTMDSDCRVELKKLKITPDKLAKIARIGLPAGLQGCLFSLSNVLIQSSINSFGSTVVAGNTAAANLEGIVYCGMNSVYQTALSFVGQNYGAGKIDRLKRIAFICLGVVTVIGLVLGGTVTLLGDTLLRLYGTNDEETAYGLIRLHYICRVYFLCGIMDVFVGLMRGMGYAVAPMIVSLTGACLLRIVWILTVFRFFGTLESLYLSYSVTWVVTATVHCICFVRAYKKKREMMPATAD
ncbi:MAG: MATE family efflux transporter [Lachnospiraceae bacterium]|nr:MATE family efflux transporter [Lachnospiraceae bacterium]